MGIRDFRDFNLAMLGKQDWRFISNSKSLVTKLYKAMYFANTDFLNYDLGHNLTLFGEAFVKQRIRLWRVLD